jgi:hypothetical protein
MTPRTTRIKTDLPVEVMKPLLQQRLQQQQQELMRSLKKRMTGSDRG